MAERRGRRPSSTSACTAWARRSTPPPSERYGAFPLRVYAPVGGPRGPAALSGPPAAGERRQHLLRPRPARRATCRPRRWSAIRSRRCAPGPARIRAIPKPRRHPACRERRSAAGVDLSIAAERGAGWPTARRGDRRRPAAADRPTPRSAEIDRGASPPPARAQPAWDATGGGRAGPVLRAMADCLERELPRLVAGLAREAGKTLADGVAEVREAADFCRYYAAIAEREFGAPSRCPARPASATAWSCTAAASSPASARGTSRWRSSPARSPRRWPPATPSSPSRPSRPR